MNLSRRERALVFGVSAIIFLWMIDRYALSPVLERQSDLQLQRDRILKEIRRGNALISERRQLAPKWNEMLSAGLKDDPAEAEGQLLHALRDWAKESGFTLTSVKPDRPESKSELKEIQIQAAGTAKMDAITGFLWQLHSAPFPLKVTDLQISSRNDGSNDLALQLKISTLYYAADRRQAKAEKPHTGGSDE